MENQSKQQTAILYSQNMDGKMHNSWQGMRKYFAYKICVNCNMKFKPVNHSEKRFMGARFCSISCSKKKENAMWVPGAKEKMIETLKKIGHRPVYHGGNGRQSTDAQLAMKYVLGDGWEIELVIPTKIKKLEKTYPTCYKVDIGNSDLKIAIEVDGSSHVGERKKLDYKKGKCTE